MKLLASDYDGTLNYNGIDDTKKMALRRWHDAGNAFTIVSGRSGAALLEKYKESGVDCDYLLADNGAVIMKSDGTILSAAKCDGNAAMPILRHLFANGCSFAVVDTTFRCWVYADLADCKQRGDYTMEDLPDISEFVQISGRFSDVESADKAVQSLMEKFGTIVNPLQNGRYIDIVRADVNKAKGVKVLMQLMQLRQEDVITVGDNINDKDMLVAFRSYAMESGAEEIKRIATFITPGVAELIQKELAE